jgi:DNA invertase Pin-like site-specific DNA recombinase
MTRRAIGIVRVSQVAGREGESFASPAEQRDRIHAACQRDGIDLIHVHEELDVSGGTPLDNRQGLRAAVEAIEAGEADVLAAAYFDRLFRSLAVQAEVVDRVNRAGGEVLAVDVGRVTSASAGQWLSGTMLGAVAEYTRRTAKERTKEAQARAVARGVLPWPHVPPGYIRGPNGVLVPDEKTRGLMVAAFDMRDHGGTVSEVRAFLRGHGIVRSFHATGKLLRSRVYLGEIHFGDLVNLTAHEPIIDRDVWQRVQRLSVPRGPKARSERLLARLGVLRCGTCGARMVVGGQNRWPFYRCPPVGDCPQRVTISAEKVETVVVARVRAVLADAEGRASVEADAADAERELERAQAALEGAIRAFSGLGDEQAAQDRLAELREARDRAAGRVEHLGGQRAVVVVSAARDWDRLTVGERRALIRATVSAVRVAPGRGDGRIRVEIVGE